MTRFSLTLLFTVFSFIGFSQTDTSGMIYDMPEIMPEFIGGADALDDFIKKNIKYPAEAKEQGIQGKVYVQFVVEKDGTVTNVTVRRGAHTLLDNEAVRVVKLMPAWKPGTMRGKKVRVRYTLPITFSLS
ncbi:MAG: energy transducer TonB [Crocinitomicaceae bacterium]|nr:energy transducer TonB [Crocinitomicaceae bacterium]MBK8925713.1 energy transducer TonB [Crocinitomicaceae bacterium]